MTNIANGLSPGLRAAYEAPFPDQRYMAGARKFPSLVPIFPDDPEIPANQAAWQTLAAFERPFLTSFSDDDPVTAGMEQVLEDRIAGAKGVEHIIIENAGHFLQEDQGPVIATKMIEFICANPVG
jgi:haloalkane dehalogenase